MNSDIDHDKENADTIKDDKDIKPEDKTNDSKPENDESKKNECSDTLNSPDEKKEDVTIMFHSGSSSNYPNCKFFTNILHVCKHIILLPYLMWDEKWLLVLMS